MNAEQDSATPANVSPISATPGGDPPAPPGAAVDPPAAFLDDPLDDEDLTVDLDFLLPTENRDALGRIGEYDVLSVEGCGGMGIVLKAYDAKLHRIVAVKVPSPELSSSRRFRERFLREGRAVAAISHPNVVTIHAVGEHNGLPYLVMEYIGGRTLRQRMLQPAPFQVADVLRIAAQIAEGLDAAHRRGVIHRDIKPSNIMLEDGVERVKITDFGLARAALDQSGLTSVGRLVGTPAYMAPEQLRDGQADVRTDLFALGCVIYSMATGRSPFRGSHTLEIIRRVGETVPELLHEVQPAVPPALSRIVARLLEKNPDDRYQSAAELATDLTRLLAAVYQNSAGAALIEKLGSSAALRLRAGTASPPSRARRRAAWVAGLTAIAALTTLPLWLPRTGDPPQTGSRAGNGVPAARKAGARPAELAGAAATDKPARLPADEDTRPDERTPERRAAEWVLGIGGTVEVLLDGTAQPIGPTDSLPARDFDVISIDLTRNERAGGGLDQLAGLTEVRSLTLYGVPTTDADLETVGSLKSLVHLDVHRSRVTDAGLKHLAGLTRLESLSIHATAITDEGVAHLADLRELQALNLSATDISDDGLRHLTGLTELRWLQLSRTRVTDAGLEHLTGLENLSELYLADLELSDEAVADLQSALPACSIMLD